jgi:hypothetical protein
MRPDWKVIMRARALIPFFVFSLNIAGPAVADQVVDGQFGPGALYRLVRPAVWNGSLVLYAHGIVSTDAAVALPGEGDVIAGILAPRGFAVAFSSFSENGWAVKDGAQRTHQLLGLFTATFGQPARVYIGGASLGGLITIKLVEEHSGLFAGALPTCAVAGGARRQFDYVGQTRALFDLFYPNVLPGNAGEIPPALDVTQAVIIPALAAMQRDPAGAFVIAHIQQTPVPFASLPELLESITTALAAHATSLSDLLARTHDHPYFDNAGTQYTGALEPALLAAINSGVSRFEASPSALNYLAHEYDPSGDLRIPMLMLSTSSDPLVPGFHQTSYLETVAAAGRSDLLVPRQIDRYGHCVFTPTELASAFVDLAAWVEFGIRPTP